jgi:hypothetical protein
MRKRDSEQRTRGTRAMLGSLAATVSRFPPALVTGDRVLDHLLEREPAAVCASMFEIRARRV